jgi:thioredoxin-related protein
MRWLAAFAIIGAAFAAQAQEPPAWFAPSFLDIGEDVAEAAKEGRRLMVYFHQDGCPYCKRLVEVNFRDARIVEKMRRGFMSIEINIFGDREVTWTDGRRMPEKQFAALLKVQFTPTLVFFDEKAEVAHRINGYLPPEQFLPALDAAMGKNPVPPKSASAPVDLRRRAGAKPLAVMLATPGCDSCDEMQRHFTLPEVRRQLARLELVKLGNPAEVLTAAGRATLRADYVPALVFLEPGGREVFRTEAYLRPFHLAASLEYVASGAYSREPSFQRFLHAKTERMRGRGERVDLWN